MIQFDELRSSWKAHGDLKMPPPKPIMLWADGVREIWVSNEWGPAVPYPPVDHGDGTFNHGYQRLKGKADLGSLIPETQNWPELQRFLELTNADSSPIETVGCEKVFFSDGRIGAPAVYLGSYFDLVFTESPLNDNQENQLLLATRLAKSVEGCEKWWAKVSLVLQKYKHLPGADMPWGLMLHVTNHGRREEEARKFWGETLLRLGKAISGLPVDFRVPA
jgi:hypothetical protein